MRPTTAAADTIRILIAAVPDDRLRELFLELALAALAVPAADAPKPARNGRRRRGRGKGWRRGKGKHKVNRHGHAYLDALNAKCREKRRLAREAGVFAPLRSRRKLCGGTPRNWSRSSPGARWHASLVSATGPPNLPTVT